MAEERDLFESEERLTLPELRNFLMELAEQLADNKIILRKDDQELVLEVPHNVVMEIEVEEEEKDGPQLKRSLEIEIEWVVTAPGTVSEEEE